jgi:hypothetical protein
LPKVTKPQFEQYLVELRKTRKPVPIKALHELAPKIEKLLEDSGEILIQKSTKTGHPEAMMELTAAWLSAQGDADGAIADLDPLWPGDVFEPAGENHTFYHRDENLVLAFAAEMPEQQYVTGRVVLIL